MSDIEYEDHKPLPNDCTVVYVDGDLIDRQIVCAANKYGDIIVLGVRHFCPLMCKQLDSYGLDGGEEHEQGFVDQWGNFMSRKEALLVLRTNGRWIRDEDYYDELYSENLY